MIRSRKIQLVMALLLACLCVPVLGAEPNEAKTELKFDIRKDLPPVRHLRPRSSSPDGETHYAVLFVRGDWDIYRRNVPIVAMLDTSIGQSMSQLQREIISNQSIRLMDSGTTISNYTYFQLFGVSQDDVQKMVSAFIEVMANFADKETQHFQKERQKYQKLIVEDKKRVAEKETEQKDVEKRFEGVKTSRKPGKP